MSSLKKRVMKGVSGLRKSLANIVRPSAASSSETAASMHPSLAVDKNVNISTIILTYNTSACTTFDMVCTNNVYCEFGQSLENNVIITAKDFEEYVENVKTLVPKEYKIILEIKSTFVIAHAMEQSKSRRFNDGDIVTFYPEQIINETLAYSMTAHLIDANLCIEVFEYYKRALCYLNMNKQNITTIKKASLAAVPEHSAMSAPVSIVHVRYYSDYSFYNIVPSNSTDALSYIEFEFPLKISTNMLQNAFPTASINVKIPRYGNFIASLTFKGVTDTSDGTLCMTNNELHIESVKYQIFRHLCLKVFEMLQYTLQNDACAQSITYDIYTGTGETKPIEYLLHDWDYLLSECNLI